MKAAKIYQFGEPQVIKIENIDKPKLHKGFVRIKNIAIGLNNIDTYHRIGLYPVKLPSGLGLEAAGIVEDITSDECFWKIGDRVAYINGPIGAYSEYHCVKADDLIKLPDFVEFEVAAAALLKAMTVRYLFYQTYKLQKGETILFQAAGGGLGTIAIEWAREIGATIIATAAGKEKCDKIKNIGAHYVIDYSRENVPEKVKEITNAKGVNVVYDPVGKDTINDSINSLAKRGMLVSFGNASGPVNNLDLAKIASAGSLYITRPVLAHYTSDRESLLENARHVFQMIQKKVLNIKITNRYHLEQIVKAHQKLKERKIIGLSVIHN